MESVPIDPIDPLLALTQPSAIALSRQPEHAAYQRFTADRSWSLGRFLLLRIHSCALSHGAGVAQIPKGPRPRRVRARRARAPRRIAPVGSDPSSSACPLRLRLRRLCSRGPMPSSRVGFSRPRGSTLPRRPAHPSRCSAPLRWRPGRAARRECRRHRRTHRPHAGASLLRRAPFHSCPGPSRPPHACDPKRRPALMRVLYPPSPPVVLLTAIPLWGKHFSRQYFAFAAPGARVRHELDR